MFSADLFINPKMSSYEPAFEEGDMVEAQYINHMQRMLQPSRKPVVCTTHLDIAHKT